MCSAYESSTAATSERKLTESRNERECHLNTAVAFCHSATAGEETASSA